MGSPSLSLKRVPPFKRSTRAECAECDKQISTDEYSYQIDRSGDTQGSNNDELICVRCGKNILNQ